MFDLKPDAPAEIRGEFRPIATSLPGLQICEHLPRHGQAGCTGPCLIRTVTHSYNAHNPLADHDRLHRRRIRPDCTTRADRPARHRRHLPVSRHGAARHARRRVHAVLSRLGRSSMSVAAGPLRRLPGQPVRSAVRGLQADLRPRARRSITTIRCCPIGEPMLPSLDALPDMTVEPARSAAARC